LKITRFGGKATFLQVVALVMLGSVALSVYSAFAHDIVEQSA